MTKGDFEQTWGMKIGLIVSLSDLSIKTVCLIAVIGIPHMVADHREESVEKSAYHLCIEA